MKFAGEIAALQQRMSACREMAERRSAVVGALAPRRGERVLEIGCGAGLLLREIGLGLGPHGLAAGIDVSEDQIAAAAVECEGVPAVNPQVGDARRLGFPDAVFDAAVAVQVIEYVEEAEAAIAEVRRVLKTGGRLLVLATNWDSAFWHGAPPALTRVIAEAWEGHAAHPNLPARLAPMLALAGFAGIRQTPVPIVNAEFAEHAFAFGLARLMAEHAVGQGVARMEAEAWIAALHEADARGEFFFSSVPILTTASAA